jgi:predicted acetyltransferase/catechol 2,3-dioxygenase-like lactoylglutathione lyase family enzyme
MRIERLHHAQITIPKGEEAAAKAFYLGLLGLQEMTKPASLQGRGGFWMRLAGQQVHVGTEDGVDRRATKGHLAYQVDDVAAWKALFEEKGVELAESVPIPGFERFEFRDPFGNRTEFIQPLLFLSRATMDYKESYIDFVREGHAQGRHLDMDADDLEANFQSFVDDLLRAEDPERLAPGMVPETHYWLILGDEWVGSLRLRHHLNDTLRKYGGHIGYEIRDGFRQRGLGHRNLALGLEKARELGLDRVLITCDSSNIGSRKIIEGAGGVLEAEELFSGFGLSERLTRRYWVEL